MTFKKVYQQLFDRYGPQHWWPGDTPFEVMVGAILTQNTAWTNVEKAIANLKAEQCLDARCIVDLPHEQIAALIKPAGYFNIKTKRLKNFCQWYLEQGGKKLLGRWDNQALRHGLLSVNGVGPETADDMMLYAFGRPVFVIDAYTRRLFERLGLVTGDETYEELRLLFESKLSRNESNRKVLAQLYNEYHALIVIHAKDFCRKRPLCGECCLQNSCPAIGAVQK
jgi:endonuclease-3 related protein